MLFEGNNNNNEIVIIIIIIIIIMIIRIITKTIVTINPIINYHFYGTISLGFSGALEKIEKCY